MNATSAQPLPRNSGRKAVHVLALPKWYPGRKDPQLGDFIRKQMQAVALTERVSVLFVAPLSGLSSREEQELTESEGPWELRCYYLPSTSSFAPWRKAVNLMRYRRAAKAGLLRVWQERGKPDLVHVHILVRPALIAWRLHQRFGIPFILSEQSSEYLDGTWAAKGGFFKWVNRRLFRRAARITAVSAHLGQGLKELGLCKEYLVVPNVVPGIDTPLPTAGLPGHFMMVADLVDRTKNVSGVLRALRSARAQGHDLQLTVIGNGADRDALLALTNDLQLNGSVHWLGRMTNTDVLRHMAQAGTVIINSNVETFSVVTGEALASGKPVIATRCGGPVAFITPDNGTLIEPRDDKALADAMIRMAATHHRYDPATVRRSVSDRFNPAAVGAQFVRVYLDVLSHG